jgi:hypothetical protein
MTIKVRRRAPSDEAPTRKMGLPEEEEPPAPRFSEVCRSSVSAQRAPHETVVANPKRDPRREEE